jgi:hypothetical protein
MSRLKEQKAWDTFKTNVNGRINFKRVENQIVDGMSDLVGINRFGVSFWIELKALEGWPKRSGTKPLARAFERGQVSFLKEWKTWKGLAFVLLRVGDEWLLLDPKPPVDLVDMNTDKLRISALSTGLQAIIIYLENLNHED